VKVVVSVDGDPEALQQREDLALDDLVVEGVGIADSRGLVLEDLLVVLELHLFLEASLGEDVKDTAGRNPSVDEP